MKRFLTFRRFLVPLLLLALLTSATAASSGEEFARGDQLEGRLGRAFRAAAKDSGVPVEVLVAVAYAETHLDDHGGQPSAVGGYGVMHLVSNPKVKSLEEAAEQVGFAADKLKSDPAANIRGGAALLAAYARQEGQGKLPGDTAGWFEAVARYSQLEDPAAARDYALQVYAFINRGLDVQVGDEYLRLEPRSVVPDLGRYDGLVSVQSTDYGPAIWNPADSSNYTVSSRESTYPINYIIIHVTQGSYSGAISWFKNPSSNVSAHYVIRSSDGQITQMVREKDIAWHAGNWTYNTQSIGIEHEGYVSNCTWFTDAMYRASAALARNIADKYGIPKDRSHIIGHNEVPGATHTDPGSCWNWSYYMSLVNQSASDWSTIIDNATAGRVRYSANWGISTWSSQRYGSNYLYATPQAISDAAYYKVNIPANDTYEIYIWYPANSGYNAATPVVIWQANSTWSGTTPVTRYVNQRVGGGQWVSLGTFPLLAGDREIIAVSRWTSGTGYVIADAFRIVRR